MDPDGAPATRRRSRSGSRIATPADVDAGRAEPPSGRAVVPVALLRALAREARFDRFFEKAARAAALLAGADGAALIGRSGNRLTYRFFHGLPVAHQREFAGYRFSATQGSVGEVLRRGQTVFNPDYAATPTAMPEFVRSGLKANLLIPVGPAGRPKAVLALAWFSHRPRRAPDAAKMDAIGLLADLIAGALRRETLEDKLRRQANVDPLTRLPNRARLDSHLAHAVARARRRQRLVAVGVIDLDEFKSINDRWGHAAGDALLRKLAQRLQSAMREGDFLCRLGGDEFVVVIDDLPSASDLDPILARLRDATQAPIGLPGGHTARIGMSLGLALYPDDVGEADDLVRAADAALYRSKARRSGSAAWWARAAAAEHEHTAPLLLPSLVAGYGEAARRLLAAFESRGNDPGAEVATTIYASICRGPEMQAVLGALSNAEQRALRRSLTDHLRALLRPDLDEPSHRQMAARVGRAHALTGVPAAIAVEALETYVHTLLARLPHSGLRDEQRVGLTQILTARLRVELQTQAQAERETVECYAGSLQTLEQQLPGFVNWTDFMRWALNELVNLPGIEAAAFGRPDALGQPVIEFSTPRFDAYVAQLTANGQEYIPPSETVNALSEASQVRAWRSEQIETTASFASDPRVRHWRDAAHAVGFRSSVSIPIRDAQDRMFAILWLYGAWPRQFESAWIRRHLAGMGQLFTRALALSRSVQNRTWSAKERREWRARLNHDGLEMHVQPVVDLRTGAVERVEALARLRLEDGRLIQPAEFLPWFGASEISRLFTLGLEQSLAALAAWDRAGLAIDLSVNLPPEVLLQDDCPRWVDSALRNARVAPARLHLEMLETEEFHDMDQRDRAVRALSALGVRLEMDDLGSGYSSLLRLRDLPFRTVKIDQGLVREAHKEPRRVIGFIGSLIRLAHTLDLRVVIEGLESAGLVEAAALLGADSGQGHAIARPMSVRDFPDWRRSFALHLDPHVTRTALGALAGHWRWEQGERSSDAGHAAASGAGGCAVDRFLRAHERGDSDVRAVHARLHAVADERGTQSAEYRELADHMAALLMQLDGAA